MTMLSFRVNDVDAAQLRAWADELGLDRSQVLREALRSHLVRLAAEHDVAAWTVQPRSDAERSLDEIAEWGPAEDWSDWTDAAR